MPSLRALGVGPKLHNVAVLRCACVLWQLFFLFISVVLETDPQMSFVSCPITVRPHSPPLILGESSSSRTVTAITKIENSV